MPMFLSQPEYEEPAPAPVQPVRLSGPGGAGKKPKARAQQQPVQPQQGQMDPFADGSFDNAFSGPPQDPFRPAQQQRPQQGVRGSKANIDAMLNDAFASPNPAYAPPGRQPSHLGGGGGGIDLLTGQFAGMNAGGGN